MNLKTHTATSQIDINDHNIFRVYIHSDKGDLLYKDIGAGEDCIEDGVHITGRMDARRRAVAIVQTQSDKYLKDA